MNYTLATILMLLFTFFSLQASSVEEIPELYDSDLYQAAHLSSETDTNDPFVKFNRAMFYVNEIADGLVLQPLATAYVTFIPQFARDRVSSVLDTLKQPLYFINYSIRGDGMEAGHTLKRFIINASIGGAGLFNPAEKLGYPTHPTDAGTTFAYYCAEPGPYLYLPIIGPTTARDGSGLGVDQFILDPAQHIFPNKYRNMRMIATVIDTRAKALKYTDDINDLSLDKYSMTRSMYLQNRQFVVAQNLKGKYSSHCKVKPMTTEENTVVAEEAALIPSSVEQSHKPQAGNLPIPVNEFKGDIP